MPKKHAPFIVGDFQIKSIKEDDPDNFIVDGYASVFGNIDSYRDIVMPGAFTKDLIENGTERPILWQHDSRKPIGIGEFSEDSTGLKVSIKMPKTSTFVSDEVMPMIRIKAVKGLSIGYRTIKEEWSNDERINRLIELKLRETSAVTFGANSLAQITAAKQFLGIDNSESDFKEYPLADDKTEFDSKESCKSLMKTVTGVDYSVYEKCFLIQDGIKSQFPYADFVKDELRIIPSAVYEATAGFVCKKSDNSEVKEFINNIYKKMGQEIPFQENNVFVDHKTYEALKKQDLTAIFNSDVILSNSVKNLIVKELGSSGGSVQSENDDFLTMLKDANKEIKI